MPTLGVNIDHIATLREARKGKEPDPVFAAMMAELGGADGIVVHLREDRRHIQDRDLRLLRETIQTKLDLEMAATDEMVKIAIATRPEMVTLVPEKRQELTTEGGLDLIGLQHDLRKMIARIKDAGIQVSVFIEPSEIQIHEAKALNADIIEIHTGRYAICPEKNKETERKRIADAATLAESIGLLVNAGHGLNYTNVWSIANIPEMNELNIGHSIIARSVFVGMEKAVSEMKYKIGGR
ncbi:MAG: pyridoxine 5'-phosphate synthase [Nitrospirota bacterium]